MLLSCYTNLVCSSRNLLAPTHYSLYASSTNAVWRTPIQPSYNCTYFLAHAAAACLLHFSLSLYFSHLCFFSTKKHNLAKLKGLLRVQPNGWQKDEPQRFYFGKVLRGVDRLGLSLLWVPNMRATRIVGHPPLTLPSESSHPTPSPPHALLNTLFAVVISTLKAVPISIQYLPTSVLVQLTRKCLPWSQDYYPKRVHISCI